MNIQAIKKPANHFKGVVRWLCFHWKNNVDMMQFKLPNQKNWFAGTCARDLNCRDRDQDRDLSSRDRLDLDVCLHVRDETETRPRRDLRFSRPSRDRDVETEPHPCLGGSDKWISRKPRGSIGKENSFNSTRSTAKQYRCRNECLTTKEGQAYWLVLNFGHQRPKCNCNRITTAWCSNV